MRIGLLSDIHSNAHALRAVLNAAKEKNVEKLLCCGDYVGYYYEPEKVIALLDNWDWDGICGNHETMLKDWINNKNRKKITFKYGSGISHAAKKLTTEVLSRLHEMPYIKKLLIDNYNYSKDFVLNLSSKNDHLIKKYHENQNTPSIPGILFREVNVEQIIDFLLKFKSFSSLTNPINPIVSYIEKRENDEMKNWDVFIYCPLAKRKYPSRNIPIGNSLIPVQSRELIKKSPSIIKFSQGKISARFIEKIGLSEKEVSEAISKWKKETITSNEVNKKDDGFPDSIFRIKGRKPLLIIHFIDLYAIN